MIYTNQYTGESFKTEEACRASEAAYLEDKKDVEKSDNEPSGEVDADVDIDVDAINKQLDDLYNAYNDAKSAYVKAHKQASQIIRSSKDNIAKLRADLEKEIEKITAASGRAAHNLVEEADRKQKEAHKKLTEFYKTHTTELTAALLDFLFN